MILILFSYLSLNEVECKPVSTLQLEPEWEEDSSEDFNPKEPLDPLELYFNRDQGTSWSIGLGTNANQVFSFIERSRKINKFSVNGNLGFSTCSLYSNCVPYLRIFGQVGYDAFQNDTIVVVPRIGMGVTSSERTIESSIQLIYNLKKEHKTIANEMVRELNFQRHRNLMFSLGIQNYNGQRSPIVMVGYQWFRLIPKTVVEETELF